jgi:hypothetical protein
MSSDNTGATQRTEVFIGGEAATKVCIQVMSESIFKADSCLDSNASSITIEFYLKAIEETMVRGIIFRIEVKGNFAVFDNKAYLAKAIINQYHKSYEAHGGKIWIDDTHRISAVIQFTLPVRGQENNGKRDTGT